MLLRELEAKYTVTIIIDSGNYFFNCIVKKGTMPLMKINVMGKYALEFSPSVIFNSCYEVKFSTRPRLWLVFPVGSIYLGIFNQHAGQFIR